MSAFSAITDQLIPPLLLRVRCTGARLGPRRTTSGY
jgi:hypothetical protein